MGNIIVGGIVLILVVLGIRSMKKKAAGGCCGGGGGQEPMVETVSVSDQEPSHYPHVAALTIEGMHCEKCKARVENALNKIEGIWATANPTDGSTVVRMKQEVSEVSIREAVRKAGYHVADYTKKA